MERFIYTENAFQYTIWLTAWLCPHSSDALLISGFEKTPVHISVITCAVFSEALDEKASPVFLLCDKIAFLGLLS